MTDVTSTFVGSIPEHYDSFLGHALFEPFAANLVRRLPTRTKGDVLEIACGTGIVTRKLRAYLDSDVGLVATDLNDAMLDYARRTLGDPPGIAWRQANATALPFASASFAAVVCAFGVMFFPDKAAAIREARRVLVDDGVFAFNVWDKIEESAHGQAATQVVSELYPGDPEADFRWLGFTVLAQTLHCGKSYR